jgi:hypothetical protein
VNPGVTIKTDLGMAGTNLTWGSLVFANTQNSATSGGIIQGAGSGYVTIENGGLVQRNYGDSAQNVEVRAHFHQSGTDPTYNQLLRIWSSPTSRFSVSP